MRQLGIFAKYWEPGRVKTRLAAALGETAAAEIYREFVVTTLERLGHVADVRVLAITPDERSADFRSLAPPAWQIEPQSAGDLGARIQDYFAKAHARGSHYTVLIGSDSPAIEVEWMDQAFNQLASHDVVLGPTDDGGYYLVGLSSPCPALFEGIAWSTADVYQQTLDAAARLQLSVANLPSYHDVDNVHDLNRLQDSLADATDRHLTELRENLRKIRERGVS